jgi:hypothetical protein
LVRYFGKATNIVLPRYIEILCSSCCSDCKSLSSISFENDSALTRIESRAFCQTSLKSITIPRHVQFIDGSAFPSIPHIAVSIEPSNPHFVVKSDFIVDSSNTRLIRYLGNETNIVIPRHIQILCSSCFFCSESLSSISFESHSELTHIESKAFFSSFIESITIPRRVQSLDSGCLSYCGPLTSVLFENDSDLTSIESDTFSYSSLKSVTIPRHVQILGSSCFSHCKSLSSVSFENDSELTRIESAAFVETELSFVIVPGTIMFIAGDAFPHSCVVAVARVDSLSEWRVWNRGPRFGLCDPFERRTSGNGEGAQ